MASSHRRILSHAVIVGLVAAVCLAGCGRKGPLEAPGAYADDSTIGTAAAPPAPKPSRPFFLDKLLD